MVYKVIKLKKKFCGKAVYMIVNIGANGNHMFGVNKKFSSEKLAKEYLSKGLFRRRF